MGERGPAAERIGWIALCAVACLVLAFLVAPILALLPLSVNDSQFLSYPMRGLTGRWYEEFLTSGRWRLALSNSFVLAGASAVLATVLGTAAALGLALADFPGKRLLNALVLTPLVVPVVVFGVGLAVLFGRIGLARTYTGLVLAHAALGSPFVVVTVGAALASFDRDLLRAASSLGAPPWLAFRRVVLPLILPGFLTGFLFAAATSFDEVVTNLMIGGPEHRTLPREMFSSIRENISPTIAAAAAVMTSVATAMLVAVELLKRRSRRLALPRGDAGGRPGPG